MARQKKLTYITANKPFPKALRELMDETDTTQPMLAESMGVTRQTISLYCNGQSTPDIDIFAKIADYFNVSFDYLLGKSESKKRENVDINKKTGLSDESIKILEEIWTKKEFYYPSIRTIDELIKNKELIEMISEYLFTQTVESEKFSLMFTERDYDGTYTDVVKQYEFDDEKHKSILLFEIQAYLKKMREKLKER